MPEWLHARAEHILAKNPSMPKSEAFAIATQQSHALGKSPKSYGTSEGKATAKEKFDTPKDDKKTANPGHLESPKMAGVLKKTWEALNTPIPGTPTLLAGRVGKESTDAVKNVVKKAPKTLEDMQAARRASRMASWRPGPMSPKMAEALLFEAFTEELVKDASLRKLFPKAHRAAKAVHRDSQKPGANMMVDKLREARGKKKEAFTTSQYSTPIEGPKTARQESSAPPFQKPPLRKEGHAFDFFTTFAKTAFEGKNKQPKEVEIKPSLLTRWISRELPKQEEHRFKELRDHAKKEGITVYEGAAGVKKLKKDHPKYDTPMLDGGFDFAIPSKQVIYVHSKDPAVLAHEMGHSLVYREGGPLVRGSLGVGNLLGAVGPLVSPLAAAISKKPWVSVPVAAVAHGPQLAHEAAASLRGMKLLRGGSSTEKELHEDKKVLLKAFGTYALPALWSASTGPLLHAAMSRKHAFAQSQYGSTGGFVDFHQVSSQPGFRKPSLATAIPKTGDFDEKNEKDKKAGVMTQTGLSPASMLASSKRVGMPKVTNPSGPSIGEIAKPKGFGLKIPGATKSL